LPKGGEWGLFGWHTVPPVPDKPKKKKGGVASNSSGDSNSTIRQTGCANHERILITEGEYDCLAAAQAISALPADHPLAGLPVVSLPNGCSSLPVELLPRLERFKQVYLWLDNDEQGQASVAKFVAKLGGAVFIRILVWSVFVQSFSIGGRVEGLVYAGFISVHVKSPKEKRAFS
jgi:twinkle protein